MTSTQSFDLHNRFYEPDCPLRCFLPRDNQRLIPWLKLKDLWADIWWEIL